jgi:hypothetical protein
MPEQDAEVLGLDLAVIERTSRYEASQALRAIQGSTTHFDVEPAAEARQDRSAYAAAHGLRAMGHLTLFDPAAASRLADTLRVFLRGSGDNAWPLASAIAPLSNDAGTLPTATGTTVWTYPLALAACLYPEQTAPPGSQFDANWPLNEPGVYGVNIPVLSSAVRSREAAVIRVLFESIEATLAGARGAYRSGSRDTDGDHWRWGISVIQPTDPEVFLALRACREAVGPDVVGELARGLEMVATLVHLLESVEAEQDRDH